MEIVLIRWMYKNKLTHCEESGMEDIGNTIMEMYENGLVYDKIEILPELKED